MPPYIRQHGVRTYPPRHPGLLWIEKNRGTLPNNHWVAANADGLVAQAENMADIEAAIRRKRLAPADVAIAYITSDAV